MATNLASDSFKINLFNVGIEVSTIIAGFLLDIIEKSNEIDGRNIFFLSREGEILKKFYDIVVNVDPYNTGSYKNSIALKISRLSSFLPSIRITNLKEDLMRMWSLYSEQSPKEFLSSLGIKDDTVIKMFIKEKLFPQKKITYPFENEKFMKIIYSEQFLDILSREISYKRKLLKDYLSYNGINDKSSVCYVVDIGWRGSIQDNLSILFPEVHFFGHYLGLFKFLYKQPINSTKFGYLFDFNKKNDYLFENIEVAVMETILMTGEGSTLSYEYDNNNNNNITPILGENEHEKFFYENYLKYIHKGIEEGLKIISNYVKTHSLTSSALLELAREKFFKLVKCEEPFTFVADVFFNAKHDENFGVGRFYNMGDYVKNVINLSQDSIEKSYNNHRLLSEILQNSRWKEGLIENSSVKNFIFDKKFIGIPSFFFRKKIRGLKIGFFVPGPIRGSGGHRTIFNLVNSLKDLGAEIFIFLENLGEGIDVLYDYLKDKNLHIFESWLNFIPLDVAIATVYYSANFVNNLKNVKYKIYLVQDYEAYFNPINDYYIIGENSYIYDKFLHLTVGKWLTHKLSLKYNSTCVPCGIGVDKDIYYFDSNISREKAICVLFQPDKHRRLASLCLQVLNLLSKEVRGLKFYIYGSNYSIKNYNVDFDFTDLGLVTDLNELRNLYNKCEIVLSFSPTNPSRIPFEAMACGCIPIDLYRYNNLFDYDDATAILAYQGVNSISEAIINLITNEKEIKNRREACLEFMDKRTLNWEIDTMIEGIFRLVNDDKIPNIIPNIKYKEEPFISPRDGDIKSIKAFCDYQKKLANLYI